MKKILDVEILIKNLQKNFGQHLLKICCATKVFVIFFIFFFANFRRWVKLASFNNEKTVFSVRYFISEYFKIISAHKKKLIDVPIRGTYINPPEEKIA